MLNQLLRFEGGTDSWFKQSQCFIADVACVLVDLCTKEQHSSHNGVWIALSAMLLLSIESAIGYMTGVGIWLSDLLFTLCIALHKNYWYIEMHYPVAKYNSMWPKLAEKC